MNFPLSLSEKSLPKRSRWPKIGDFNFIVMVNWLKTSLASSCIYLSRTARVMVIYHATRYRVYEKNKPKPQWWRALALIKSKPGSNRLKQGRILTRCCHNEEWKPALYFIKVSSTTEDYVWECLHKKYGQTY